jgi:amidophosphoribosyltransferase
MSLRHHCGVVGVWGHPEASKLCYLGLYAQQHRGQEGAGIVSSSQGERLHAHRGAGLVADVFKEQVLERLPGDRAIGHNRYSTAGGSLVKNLQPLVVNYHGGKLALAHNGSLVNVASQRAELEAKGAIFQSRTDTEILLHLVARSAQRGLVNRIVDALQQVEGAYCLLFLSSDRMIAVRDPLGFRPLVIGELAGAQVVASESCALDLLGARLVREVEPGEMVVFDERGMHSLKPMPARQPRHCVFEYVYFARPDSELWGRSVYQARIRCGVSLAREHPAPGADLVVPVPDSGTAAALGYAQESGARFDLGLVRNHYVGRTFIEPAQTIRDFGVRLKLNPVRGLLRDQRVVVVDDSLVRGTTCSKIVRILREAGAAEVHVRVAAPPTIAPCFYGIDTPNRSELIAANMDRDSIRNFLGADSLGFLSLEGLHASVHKEAAGNGFCDACFSERYPIQHEELDRAPPQLPLFGGEED